MQVICPVCRRQENLSPERWRCDCGAPWEPVLRDPFDPALIDRSAGTSLGRYWPLYGLAPDRPPVALGGAPTPLVPMTVAGRTITLKLEYLLPTGSFKDRGTAVMIGHLKAEGVRRVVEDSSGNAGASVAAYAARAGMAAEIFVPAHASPNKQAQIAVYGAQVRPIAGPRINAKLAAWEAATGGAVYASHTYHPAFLLGQASAAWEVWEQLWGEAPDWIVLPAGQGVHLLGTWLGFRQLLRSGLVNRLPRLVAVQSDRVAPIAEAWAEGLESVPGVEPGGTTRAEGIAIARPVRGERVLEAIRESGGSALTVTEDAIGRAQRELAHGGIYVEPTSAAALAALEQLLPRVGPEETVLVPLTGSGLKGSPRMPRA